MVKISVELDDKEYAEFLKAKNGRTSRETLLDGLGIDYETRPLGRPTSKAFDPAKYEEDAKKRYLDKLRAKNAEEWGDYVKRLRELGHDVPEGLTYDEYLRQRKQARG